MRNETVCEFYGNKTGIERDGQHECEVIIAARRAMMMSCVMVMSAFLMCVSIVVMVCINHCSLSVRPRYMVLMLPVRQPAGSACDGQLRLFCPTGGQVKLFFHPVPATGRQRSPANHCLLRSRPRSGKPKARYCASP